HCFDHGPKEAVSLVSMCVNEGDALDVVPRVVVVAKEVRLFAHSRPVVRGDLVFVEIVFQSPSGYLVALPNLMTLRPTPLAPERVKLHARDPEESRGPVH